MIRIRAPTAHRDVTYNNIKASKSSVNDMFCQSITKIDGASHVEVFATLEALKADNTSLREQLARLNTSLGALDARVNELDVAE
jgi:hypothetical protein